MPDGTEDRLREAEVSFVAERTTLGTGSPA